MEIVSISDIVMRNEEIIAANMDGEIVMMNIETGNYYNLGKTGSAIWNMLEHPISVETLIRELVEKYPVSRQQCEEETLTFLTELREEGLIVIR